VAPDPSGVRLRRSLPLLALAAGPVFLALVLSIRTLGWPFLWDDFDFLGRVANLRLGDLLPVRDVVFYRPVSREIYFWIITHVLGGSLVAAHIANAAVTASIVVLLVSIGNRLAGARAGLISGTFFACSAALPLATGWISASQDLLCLLFALIAFHLQLSRRVLVAGLAMGAALLSKETAIALMPVPIAISVFQRWSRAEILRSGLIHLSVLALWALIHPWTRAILLGDLSPGESSGEYVAFRGASALSSSVHGLALTLNLRWVGSVMRWTGQNVVPALIATGAIGFLLARTKTLADPAPRADASSRTLMGVGALTMAGPIALTSLALRDWSPHYALIPTLGFSLLAGAMFGRRKTSIVMAGLAIYLWLGIVLRDTTTDPTIPSELNFSETAEALRKVEVGFKRLRPSFPPNANVYVSVQARGHGGIYRQLFRFQPLRVWYRQPDIWVLDPNRVRRGAEAEFLFWITPDLEIMEIDLGSLEPRGGTGQVSLGQYQKALRGYAFGLASSGKVDRAVEILTTMPQTSTQIATFDHRSAAMLLIARGREPEAAALLRRVPSFDPASSIEAVSAVLIEPWRDSTSMSPPCARST
jgi:Dolichyl-phosphate-mannose-protein mannosyltransferase